MVDAYGRWSEEDYSTYPKEKWCDYDTAANIIRNTLSYTPKTSMENLIIMIFLHGEDEIYDDNGYLVEEKLLQYIEGSGIENFDYEC